MAKTCELGECENDPKYTDTPVIPPLPEDCGGGGGGGGDGHKYTFRGTSTGWEVLEDGKVVYRYTDKDTSTTYTWQATTEGWVVKDNTGKVVFTYTDKTGKNTTYSFEKKDDCGFKVTDSDGAVVFDYDNDCAGTTYTYEQTGVDFKVTDNNTGQVVFTYKGTVDTNTTYTWENYKDGFKVTDSDGVVAYTYDPTLGDRSDGSYPIDTLLTTVFKGHTTISTGQIVGFTPADLVVGETLVYDGVGSVGVITADNGDGTYQVTTMTTSPGSRQGVRLGSVNTVADLPATCAAAEAMGWQTPQLGDFAYVTTGGAGDVVSEYVITTDTDCNLTWTFSHSFNAGDYQEQSTTSMSGMILTGGAVQGTFGTPIDPSTLIRGVKRNGVLLTPDAQGKVNVIVDDSHIIVNALPTTGIVDKAEYVVIDANQKVTGTWVHDATGWYQTYAAVTQVKAHQVVTALPTTAIEENVEYVVVDAQNKVTGTWVYDPAKGWLQTEVLDKPAHIVVKDLPTTGIDDEAEYVQVSDLTDPVNTFVATWVHTAKGWVKTAEASTATQAHIAVTALPTTNINENAEYLVMTDLTDPSTLTGTWVRVNGNWVQTEKMENGFHIVTALPTSNIDDKNEYIVVEDLTKPDETLIGHYAYDKATNKWISLSSKYEVYRGLSINGYTTNADDFQDSPVGNVISYFGNDTPAHYLACDGAEYNIGTHPELEAFFVEQFGAVNHFGGNGTTTWAVPDLRGEFLRGTGENSHTNPGMATNEGDGAAVGDHQIATVIQNNAYNAKPATNGTVAPTLIDSGAVHGDAYSVGNGTAPGVQGYVNLSGTRYNSQYGQLLTTRPTNTSVKYCIKAESTYAIVPTDNKYAVSATVTYVVTDATMITPTLSAPSGNAAMVSADNHSFVAPVDGFYSVSFMFPEGPDQHQTYFGSYVYLNDVIVGNNREQTGNYNNSGSYNSTFALNDGATIQMKKGDTVVIKVWTDLTTAATYTRTGRAAFVLLQPAGGSISPAETMLKPNTWPVGVEQDFGDGVYGYRVQIASLTTIPATGSGKAIALLRVLPASLKAKHVLDWGGTYLNSNNYFWSIPGSYAGGEHILYISNHTGVPNGNDEWSISITETAAGTMRNFDIWVLYTKD